ncbi:MAG: hypothetical protein WAK11_09785, partial [Candidatus Cybelea sp.]
ITNAAREQRFRAAVDKVTQSFTRVTYAQVAELDYNDSHPDLFANLLPDDQGAWDAHVNYVKEEFTRKSRRLGIAAMARWARPIARLIKGTDDYEPFTEEMKKIGLPWIGFGDGDGTVEIKFVAPEKSASTRQRERLEQAQRRLMKLVNARLRDSLTEPQIVRIVSQDGGEERYESGEGWRAAYADADRQRAADRAE